MWLRSLYDRRKQWAACFTWGYVTYGIHSTQRSEAIHASISCWCSKTNMLVELYQKLSNLAKTHAMTSATLYVRQLWKDTVRRNNEDYAFLREIKDEITPKAFDAIQNQASLFPRYRVSPYDTTKEGYHVMYESVNDRKKISLMPNDANIYKISYVTSERRQDLVSLDEGLNEFTSISFVDATLKVCSCQYSTNYGLPCRHQLAVAFVCGLKSITTDFVDKFWLRNANEDNSSMNMEIQSNIITTRNESGKDSYDSSEQRFDYLKTKLLPICQVASKKTSLFYSFSTTIDNWTLNHTMLELKKENLISNPKLPPTSGKQKRKRPLFGPTSGSYKKYNM